MSPNETWLVGFYFSVLINVNFLSFFLLTHKLIFFLILLSCLSKDSCTAKLGSESISISSPLKSIYFSEGQLINILEKKKKRLLFPGIMDSYLSQRITKGQSLFFLLSKSWDSGLSRYFDVIKKSNISAF